MRSGIGFNRGVLLVDGKSYVCFLLMIVFRLFLLDLNARVSVEGLNCRILCQMC